MTPTKQGTYEFDRESLIEIRKRMGVSQSKMADLLGVPANTLSRWETGVTVPDGTSLAAIYSVAKEHGIDPPSFIVMRRNPIALKISSEPSDQAEDSLAFYRLLQSYLTARIELVGSESKPVITVEITNSAPATPDWPRVVFMGVGLSLAYTGEVSDHGTSPRPRISRTSEEKAREVAITPWQNDSKIRGLLTVAYHAIGEKPVSFPDVTSYEQQYGEVLFPRQSVTYEIDTTPEVLPYLQVRIEGTVSRRHLFHCEQTIVMPDSITKPLMLSALNDFKAIDLYGPLKAVISLMPRFDSDTRLAEVRSFSAVLSSNIAKIKASREEINNVWRQHRLSRLRAHLRAAFIYLDRVADTLARMNEAMASGISDRIAAEASAILALEGEGIQLDRETEDLMHEYNISRDEMKPTHYS